MAAAPAAVKAALTPATKDTSTAADDAAATAAGPDTSTVESTRDVPSQTASSSAAGVLPAARGDGADSPPPPTPGRLGASAYKLFGQQADLEDATYLPPPPEDGEVSPTAYTPSGADARFAALASSTSHTSEADRGALGGGPMGSRSVGGRDVPANIPAVPQPARMMEDAAGETSEEDEEVDVESDGQGSEEEDVAGANVPAVALPGDGDEFADANDRMEDAAPAVLGVVAAAPVAGADREMPPLGSRGHDAAEPIAPVPGHGVKPSMDSMAVNGSTSDLAPMYERVVSVPVVAMEDEEDEAVAAADVDSREVAADRASAGVPAVVASDTNVDDDDESASWRTGSRGLAAGTAAVAATVAVPAAAAAHTAAQDTEDVSEDASDVASEDTAGKLASRGAFEPAADSAPRASSETTPPTSSRSFANGHGVAGVRSDRHAAGPEELSTPRNSRIRESTNVQMSPPKAAPLASAVRTVQVVGASEAGQYLAPKVTTHSILIPGTNRASTGRRFAVSATGLSAYVIDSSVRASRKVGSAVQSVNLRGHKAQIVDVEFLPSLATDPLHILGTCDTDSVVFLWFLTLRGLPEGEGTKGPSAATAGATGTVRLVRKYSFYTLRRSRAVHYNRIRLAGNTSAATMVLVPNDGSPPRLIKLTATPIFDEAGERVVAAQVAEADRARDEFLEREDEPPVAVDRGPGTVVQEVPVVPVVGLPMSAAPVGAAAVGTGAAMAAGADTDSDTSSQETDGEEEETDDAPGSSGVVAGVPAAPAAAIARAPSSQMVETDDASDSPSSADSQSGSEETMSDEDDELVDEEEEEVVVEEDVDDEEDVAVPRSTGSVPMAPGLTGVSHMSAPMDSLTADDTPMLRAQTFPMENGHSVEVEDDIAAATADALGSTAPGDQYDEADDSAGHMGRQYQDEEPSEGALL